MKAFDPDAKCPKCGKMGYVPRKEADDATDNGTD